MSDALGAAIAQIDAWDALADLVDAQLRQFAVHPADASVLLPYPSLVPLARQAWRMRMGSGFAPRFETALQCASRLGGPVPGPGDVSFDTANDRLSAGLLLTGAGIEPLAPLVTRLVERAYALAQPAAAAGPQGRMQWAQDARRALSLDLPGSPLALDTALSLVAVEWCLASRYATDVLFMGSARPPWERLFVLDPIAPDPITKALTEHWHERCTRVAWKSALPEQPLSAACTLDAGQEADLAAALILQHIQRGQTPVALVANDRFLTRRVSAMLKQRGVALHDETGWTLSTTRMAACAMGALRACAWNAGCDDVLEWLKASPEFDQSTVSALERQMRSVGEPQWSRFVALHAGGLPASAPAAPMKQAISVLLLQVEKLRAGMLEDRTLPKWLAQFQALLQRSGAWQQMEQDAAGGQSIHALRLTPQGRADLVRHEAARRHWSRLAFVTWVDAVLESQRFIPPTSGDAQVIVLPMGQLMGRDFAALVMPGCDERQLSASPDLQRPWSEAQLRLLGLPTRPELESAQRHAWVHATASKSCELLWHEKELGDEPVLPSPLLRELQLQGLTQPLIDPRQWQQLSLAPIGLPRPQGSRLPVASISASAYEDLRRCPYRFFALRQLGLREQDEIEEEIGKREFGVWLHELLRRFHETLPPDSRLAEQERLLEQCAQAATRALHLDEAQFLPFQAVWPNIKAGYLGWLADRQASGIHFESAERRIERDLVLFKLVGRIDRIDRMPDGAPLLIDYKTEDLQKTAKRVKTPLEDTQLAFYAALVEERRPQALYLNIGERGEVQERAQRHVQQASEALLDGLWSDMQRIGAGTPLPALGEGESCEHCAARGLCRKDFWSTA